MGSFTDHPPQPIHSTENGGTGVWVPRPGLVTLRGTSSWNRACSTELCLPYHAGPGFPFFLCLGPLSARLSGGPQGDTLPQGHL